MTAVKIDLWRQDNLNKSIGGSTMSKENEPINQMKEMRSHLYQIKILLLILIVLCVFGFYGISRAIWDNITRKTTHICEALMVAFIFIAPILLFIWIREMNNPPTATFKIEKEEQ